MKKEIIGAALSLCLIGAVPAGAVGLEAAKPPAKAGKCYLNSDNKEICPDGAYIFAPIKTREQYAAIYKQAWVKSGNICSDPILMGNTITREVMSAEYYGLNNWVNPVYSFGAGHAPVGDAIMNKCVFKLNYNPMELPSANQLQTAKERLMTSREGAAILQAAEAAMHNKSGGIIKKAK